MLQAMRRLLDDHPELAEKGAPIAEEALARYLCLSDLPEPDLFIRTGGEQRISNFLLWQSAYTEFYFTPLLWPEFDGAALTQAIQSYQSRERRFGRTSGQVAASQVVPNASRAK
jgi:undecaprenyl diphosphate synthase